MKVINRIKDKEQFVFTVKKGQVLKQTPLIVHFIKNELNVCRIGISVSKKLGNAVTRNRVKRQTRAMCVSFLSHTANSHWLSILHMVI